MFEGYYHDGARRRSHSYSHTTFLHDFLTSYDSSMIEPRPNDEPTDKEGPVHIFKVDDESEGSTTASFDQSQDEENSSVQSRNCESKEKTDLKISPTDTDVTIATRSASTLEQKKLPSLLGRRKDSDRATTKDSIVNKPGECGSTLMIRNVPYRLSQKCLLKALRCLGLVGEIALLYMPGNLQSKTNSAKQIDSYAFLHVKSRWAQSVIMENWHNKYPFPNHYHARPIDVSLAKVQGAEQNLERWNNTKTSRIRNPNFRPMVFDKALSEKFGSPCCSVHEH